MVVVDESVEVAERASRTVDTFNARAPVAATTEQSMTSSIQYHF